MSCGSELVRNDPLFIYNRPLDLELWCSEGLTGTNLSMSFAEVVKVTTSSVEQGWVYQCQRRSSMARRIKRCNPCRCRVLDRL